MIRYQSRRVPSLLAQFLRDLPFRSLSFATDRLRGNS